jgi:iron complex transport system ATP-binding protein
MTVFTVRDLRVAFGDATILEDVSFDIDAGSVVAVVGPNGAGKTTLVRVLSRTCRPARGEVLYKGKDLFRIPTRTVARSMAVLPQIRHAPHGLTVEGLVEFGRFPHGDGRFLLSGQDRSIVEWALEKTHVTHLRACPLARLSGGEQQRAWIAMALAQKPDVLVLDEPTTFLDIAYQLEVLELLRELNRESALTTVMVLHDLNHALRYADSIMILKDRRLRAVGPGKDVLTRESLNREFSIDGDIHWDERNDCPFIVAHKQVHHGNAL